MRKRGFRLLLVSLSVLLLFCMAGSASSAPVHRMSFTIGDPESASKTVFYKGLADKTRAATNGGLDITVYAGGTLFGHMECLEGVLSGAADMGWFYTPWAPNQFPLTEIVGLPLLFGSNQMASTYMLQELYKRVPELQKELSIFKVVNLYTQPTNFLFTRFPIAKPDDLRGKQIRSMAGAAAACLTSWGASPAFISAVEIYEAMDKGVIQGAVYEWSGVKSNSLYEVIDHCTYVPLFANPFLAIMNHDSYARIPAEYKAAFDEIWCAPQTSFDFAKMFADEAEESRADGVANHNIKEKHPDKAMLDLFRPGADEFIAQWIKNNGTSTFDARKFIDLAQSLYEEGCKVFPEK